MLYGYCRVSTRGQEVNGNGLDVQERLLREAGAQEIVSDAFTGTTMERPEWERLMSVIKPGDTVMVTKLDRIARTASKGVDAVKSLLDRGVRVHILNIGLVDDTPTGRLMLNVMFAIAEFDRDMIVSRLAEGREQARMNDPEWREGRPRIYTDSELLERLVQEEKAGKTVRQCAKELGVSERTYRRRRDELLAA